MNHPNTTYWFIALIVGSIINLSFYLFLPALSRTEPPAQVKVIDLDFITWQKPAPKKVHMTPKQKPTPKPQQKPKLKPKPKPIKKIIPIKPDVLVKPTPQPVLTETVVKEKLETNKVLDTEPVEIKEQIAAQITPEPIVSKRKVETLPTPVPIFKLTRLPRMLHHQTPVYPPAMKQQGKEATVKLEILLDIKGKIRKISVKRSAGDAFDQAAINAIRQSSFIPANVNGKPVAVLMKIPVKFRLR